MYVAISNMSGSRSNNSGPNNWHACEIAYQRYFSLT